MAQIAGLQAIPRDYIFDNGLAAMLVEQTKGASEKSFVHAHQNGGSDI